MSGKTTANCRPSSPQASRLCLQVYHLASVRLRDLCWKLDISSDLRGKIWTCFEHTLIHCTDLMRGRHLDQLLLCSVYIMSKVRKQTSVLHIWSVVSLI